MEKPIYAVEDTTVTLTLRNKVSDHRETILGEVLGRIEEQWPRLTKSQRTMIEVLIGKQEATAVAIQSLVERTRRRWQDGQKWRPSCPSVALCEGGCG